MFLVEFFYDSNHPLVSIQFIRPLKGDLGGLFVFVFGRIEKHSGTKTMFTAGELQYVVVNTALTTLPEGFIVGQLRKCNRSVGQFRVYFHNRKAGG